LLLGPLKDRLPTEITSIPFGEKQRLLKQYAEWDAARKSGVPGARAAEQVWGDEWRTTYRRAALLHRWREEIQKRDVLAGKRATAIVRRQQ
jgi:hypothetical protein